MPNDNNPKNNRGKSDSIFFQAIDLIFKITTTSFTTSIFTAPITMVLTRKQKPDMLKSPVSSFGMFVRVLQSQAIANQQRGALSVTSAHLNKRNNAETLENNEEIVAKRWTYNANVASVVFSQADTAVAAIFNNRAKLLSRPDVTKVALNGYNMRQLFFMGYPIKSLSNFFSFIALLKLSDAISHRLPMENTIAANFVGGALAGGISSIITHPLAAANDRIILNTKINAAGQLSRMTCLYFFKNNVNYIKTLTFNDTLKMFWVLTRNELPVRMLNTMIVFAIIQGFNHLMGDKPITQFLEDKNDQQRDLQSSLEYRS